QRLLNLTGNLIVALADDGRIKHAGGRVERVNGRIDTQLRDLTGQNGRRVQMGEGGCRRRVSQVVGRNVNGLNGRDRALVGGGNTLLQGAHVGRERRLIAHSGGDTAEQSGHFGAGLRETEDVVDEEQNVLAFDVTEIFRLREAGESNTHTGSGRLVHLAIDQRHLGLVAFGVDNAAFDHFVVKVVTLTRPLANASEHRVTAVAHGDVVDQLHDQNRLANAGAAEEADLTALGVRREEVNNLNTGHQNFRFRGLIREIRGRRVDGSGP